MSRLLMQH